jgi:hypothetical protein
MPTETKKVAKKVTKKRIDPFAVREIASKDAEHFALLLVRRTDKKAKSLLGKIAKHRSLNFATEVSSNMEKFTKLVG